MTCKPFKADLHIHTCHSKDSLAKPKDVLSEAVKKGMSAVAITDHNEVDGAFEAAQIAKDERLPIQVIIGEEVLCEEGDLLVYFLKRRINPGPLNEVLKEVKRQGAACCAAHPYDFARHAICLKKLDRATIFGIDAIEAFNARTPIESMDRKARLFAESHGKAALAGSDAHHPSEVGTAYVEFSGIRSLDKKSLLSAKRRIRGSRSLLIVRLYTRYAALRKRLAGNRKAQP